MYYLANFERKRNIRNLRDELKYEQKKTITNKKKIYDDVIGLFPLSPNPKRDRSRKSIYREEMQNERKRSKAARDAIKSRYKISDPIGDTKKDFIRAKNRLKMTASDLVALDLEKSQKRLGQFLSTKTGKVGTALSLASIPLGYNIITSKENEQFEKRQPKQAKQRI